MKFKKITIIAIKVPSQTHTCGAAAATMYG